MAECGRNSGWPSGSSPGWTCRPDAAGWTSAAAPGALVHTILHAAAPERVTGVDPSAGFLATAARDDPRVEFRVGDARDLRVPDADADVVVSGLAATGPIRLTARAWAVRGTA